MNTTSKTTKRKKHSKIILTLSVIFFALLLGAIFYSIYLKTTYNKQIKTTATKAISKAAGELNKDIIKAKKTAKTLANNISSNQLKKDQFISTIKTNLDNSTQFFAIGISYHPDTNYNDMREKSSYYVTQKKSPKAKTSDYIHIATEPFYSYDPKTKERTPKGIVFVDLSKHKLNKILNLLHSTKINYDFIVDEKGTFIHYPITSYVGKKTLHKVAVEQKNSTLKKLAKDTLLGKSGNLNYYDKYTGQLSRIYFHYIPEAKWTICSVVPKTISFEISRVLFFWKIAIVLLGIIFLSLLAIYITSPTLNDEKKCWRTSISISIILLFGIIAIWNLAINNRYSNVEFPETTLVDNATLDSFTSKNTSILRALGYKNPIYIPTGILVESVKFEGEGRARIIGYVWQKIKKQYLNLIKPGVFFSKNYSINMRKIYAEDNGEDIKIGWHFDVMLQQYFNIFKYPLDIRDITLQIQPKEQSKRIVLIPDLSSYRFTNPTNHPGVKIKSIHGWRIDQSFFSYHGIKGKFYDKNLGLANYIDQYPQLTFHILTKRDFSGPLFADMIPIVLINLVLFFLLTVATETKFTTYLTVISGVLVSTIIAFMRLGAVFETSETPFMNYFYLYMYVCMLVLVINAFILKIIKKNHIMHYRKNLLVKVSYLPFVLSGILIISTLVFALT